MERPTTSKESTKQYTMDKAASDEDLSQNSLGSNIPASQPQKSTYKRVHEEVESDDSGSVDEINTGSKGKVKTPMRKKKPNELDDSTTFREMAESVCGIASMLKKKAEEKPFAQMGVAEMWAGVLGKRLTKLSGKRSRRLMAQIDNIVLEAEEEEEELEQSGPNGTFGQF